MDYISAPFGFKLRKGLRYVRLYGPTLTAVKVRSLYHMKRDYDSLPDRRGPRTVSNKHVAIVGCGRFAFAGVAYHLKRVAGRVVRCTMDVNLNRAASLFQAYDADYYTDDFSEILSDDQVDLVFILSNHASHAEYAIEAMKSGKSVHIEKPHVVTEDQLQRLRSTMEEHGSGVRLGFNRPYGRIGRAILSEVKKESGPITVNWFIAGHSLERDHWYYAPEEGGRVLGNLTHWMDFTYRLIPEGKRFPIVINPTRGEVAEDDFVVSYRFGDGSLATISFSAKGHTFEGVMERLALHRGGLLITMDDFQTMTVQRGEHKKRKNLMYRDHGHRASVKLSYALPSKGDLVAHHPDYVYEVGLLTLKTKEAVESGQPVVLDAPESSRGP